MFNQLVFKGGMGRRLAQPFGFSDKCEPTQLRIWRDGMGWRIAALGLSVVNGVVVISLSEIAPAALQQHVFWGSLLAGLAIYGSGSRSMNRWLSRRAPACVFYEKAL